MWLLIVNPQQFERMLSKAHLPEFRCESWRRRCSSRSRSHCCLRISSRRCRSCSARSRNTCSRCRAAAVWSVISLSAGGDWRLTRVLSTSASNCLSSTRKDYSPYEIHLTNRWSYAWCQQQKEKKEMFTCYVYKFSKPTKTRWNRFQ